jgi:hypothetical protein
MPCAEGEFLDAFFAVMTVSKNVSKGVEKVLGQVVPV